MQEKHRKQSAATYGVMILCLLAAAVGAWGAARKDAQIEYAVLHSGEYALPTMCTDNRDKQNAVVCRFVLFLTNVMNSGKITT